ncbi:DUF5372 family protein [Rhizobium beringeri]|uniref:DUF5372 family protein n=1 Tax=Rhizobium beringeri TaxID=3019934 RepID=UPI003B5B6C08
MYLTRECSHCQRRYAVSAGNASVSSSIQLPCVGKRYNRHGERLLLQTEDATVWSVPPQWTDLVSLDPEVVMSNGRSLLRFADLMELAALMERLSSKSGTR